MKKWILYVYFILPFFSWSEMPSSQNELQMIEKEIPSLKDRLHQNRLKIMKEEVEGQNDMIADWNAYAKKLEFIRKQEEENQQLQQQINKLEERRKSLIEQ